ncbi:MAG: DNA polymerase I, partial [Gammaproteobacteria bacterium]
DDVIGTLASRAAAAGQSVLISTSDKDMAQLVDEHVTLVNTMSETQLNPEGVVDKFGVPPHLIIDYLALVGDTSDNIPGVPSVGPKTAVKWLTRFGDLEAVRANADQITGKVGERLREHLDALPLYRDLATIRCDLDLGTEAQELARRPVQTTELSELFQRLELKNLLRRLEPAPTSSNATTTAVAQGEPRYDIIDTMKSLDSWIKRFKQAPLVAFDTETTSLNYMQAQIVGLSFATETGQAAYVPVAHRYPGAPDQLDRDKVLERMRPWLENPKQHKVGHHLKYDTHVLKNHGIELKGIAFDTMLESYVLNSTATRHDMDSVAGHYLEVDTTSYTDVAGKGAKQLSFDQVPIETAGPYAAEDADITLQLHQRLWPEIETTGTLAALYTDLEQPLMAVLQKMEYTGVLVDAKMLKRQSQELALTMQALEAEAHKEANGPFNLGSPKQLQEVLYQRLELPVLGKTPKGQPSTAEDVLQELAVDYRLPAVILEYRGVAKLKSTYTDKLPLDINPGTGRIHTSYHQAVAATGRLSSSDPNLQNIPIRTAEGRRIREAFIAPKGYCLVAADYSQIELRIMAHLSQDKGLLAAFKADQDIHRATAAEVFGIPPDDVSSDQRRSAKAINFGLIYGMSAFGLARQLGIERREAAQYVERYFERYPGVKGYMDETREQARIAGFVETVFGRRLYLPDIKARNFQRRQYAERSAINAPMQGTAADIIKRAMIDVDRWLAEEQLDARITMQVHDELVLEVGLKQADDIAVELA